MFKGKHGEVAPIPINSVDQVLVYIDGRSQGVRIHVNALEWEVRDL